MSEIIDIDAYFATVVRNMDKKEYRQNDNAAKYITSVGLIPAGETKENIDILSAIHPQTSADWLMLIENPALHKALKSLKTKDLDFLFAMIYNKMTHDEMAELIGMNQSNVTRRYNRIISQLRKALQ